MSSIPASPKKIDSIRAETAADEQLQEVIRYIQAGWPEHLAHINTCVREYFPVRNELSMHDGVVTRGSRIVIPGRLRSEILERIHEGHQGLNKCRDRANTSVWWPGIATQITHKVENCMYCREQRRAQNREPLLSTPLPDQHILTPRSAYVDVMSSPLPAFSNARGGALASIFNARGGALASIFSFPGCPCASMDAHGSTAFVCVNCP